MDERLKKAISEIVSWPYFLLDGTRIRGVAVSGVAGDLREMGWRNVPRIDSYDLEKAGFKVVRARFKSGGGRLKKECDVLVLG